ncbi:MAG: FecR domain-containing protein [Planctomycetota bacterium]|jgi:hypothetical protein
MMNKNEHLRNCDRWTRDFWVDLARGDLPLEEAKEAKAHLASCALCRKQFEDSARLVKGLHGILQADETTVAPGLHEAIMASARAQSAARGEFASTVLRNRFRWAVAAAVLIVAVGGALYFGLRGDGERRGEGESMAGFLPPERKAAEVGVPDAPPTPLKPSEPAQEDPGSKGAGVQPLPGPPEKPSEPGPQTPPTEEEVIENPKPDPVEKPTPPAKKTPPREPEPVAFVLKETAGSLHIDGGSGGPVDLLEGDVAHPKGRIRFQAVEESSRTRVGSNRLSIREGSTGAIACFGEGWKVRIDKGEMFCEVNGEKEERFSVLFPQGNAQAEGTAFGIRVASGGTLVFVTEGRVAVRNGKGKADLGARQVSLVGEDIAPQVTGDDPPALAWVDALEPNRHARIHIDFFRSFERNRTRLGPRHLLDPEVEKRQLKFHRLLQGQHKKGITKGGVSLGGGGFSTGKKGRDKEGGGR